jgi:hypothetical protein
MVEWSITATTKNMFKMMISTRFLQIVLAVLSVMILIMLFMTSLPLLDIVIFYVICLFGLGSIMIFNAILLSFLMCHLQGSNELHSVVKEGIMTSTLGRGIRRMPIDTQSAKPVGKTAIRCMRTDIKIMDVVLCCSSQSERDKIMREIMALPGGVNNEMVV